MRVTHSPTSYTHTLMLTVATRLEPVISRSSAPPHVYSPSLIPQPAPCLLSRAGVRCARSWGAPPSTQTAAPSATLEGQQQARPWTLPTPASTPWDPDWPPERSLTRTYPVLSRRIHTHLTQPQKAISRQCSSLSGSQW